MERESMEYDVVIVGGGPSGLATAIRLKQAAAERDRDIEVCIVEKGSEIGAHLLSGAVFEPRALEELFPDWQERGAPLTVPARDDQFLYLTRSRAIRMPTPPQMHNDGNYIISLGNLARWLAEQAEALGVEIYPGFAAAEVLYNDDGSVAGVATGDMGLDAEGNPTAQHEPGVELRARQTVFAEGCRGSLTKQVIERFELAKDSCPQTYGLGIKELWEIDPALHEEGKVVHTIGWPMDSKTYGGSWLYHFENNLISVGFVVGLDYTNPHLSPFHEMQRFKLHPAMRPLFEGARRVSYGARALVEGGYQSVPTLAFPGGVLVGDSAGFLNVPKIKGNHTAMKSGMVAAEALVDHLGGAAPTSACEAYPAALKESWLWDELYRVRNIRPSFRFGLPTFIAYSALDTYLFRGKAPWTFRHRHGDHETLTKASEAPKIEYPKPDGRITFDRLSSVFLSNTNHREGQPCHLTLKDDSIPVEVNLAEYDAPEQRYCPAAVYEIVRDDDGSNPRLHINAQNCVHCKTCDIKDPRQNINWVVPEGGGGPNYPNM